MNSPKAAPYEWLTLAAATGFSAVSRKQKELDDYRKLFEAGKSFDETDDESYYMAKPQTMQEQPSETDTAATPRTSPVSRLTARRLLSRPPSSSRGGAALRPQADSFDPPTRRSTAPATSSPLRNVATLTGRTPTPEPIPSTSARPPPTHDTGLTDSPTHGVGQPVDAGYLGQSSTTFAIDQDWDTLKRRHTWGQASDGSQSSSQATAPTVPVTVSCSTKGLVLKHSLAPRSWKKVASPQPSSEGDAKDAAFPPLGTALHKSAAQSEKTDAFDGPSA